MLRLLLENDGHDVVTADNGSVALALAASFTPDVVILDIGMPGMDGYEIARRLRLDPSMARTTLIALTGYGRPRDIEQSHAVGFDHHLVKPLNIEALRRLLD